MGIKGIIIFKRIFRASDDNKIKVKKISLFSITKMSILFDFFLKFPPSNPLWVIPWTPVKKPNGMLQEPSHLVLYEYPPGVFTRGSLR